MVLEWPCTSWPTGVPLNLMRIFITIVRKCETLGFRKTLDPKLFPLLPKVGILPIQSGQNLRKLFPSFKTISTSSLDISHHCNNWIRIWKYITHRAILRSWSSSSYAVSTRLQIPQVLNSCLWKSWMIHLHMDAAILYLSQKSQWWIKHNTPGLYLRWWRFLGQLLCCLSINLQILQREGIEHNSSCILHSAQKAWLAWCLSRQLSSKNHDFITIQLEKGISSWPFASEFDILAMWAIIVIIKPLPYFLLHVRTQWI